MAQVGHLNELHDKYFDKGLRIIAISDEGPDLLESKMVKEKSARYWIGSDPGKETAARFIDPGRRGIPHAYLVDARGVVVGEGVPSEQKIEELLKEIFDADLGKELAPALKGLVKSYEKGDIGKAWAGAEKYLAGEDRTVVADAEFLRGKCEAYGNFLRSLVEQSVAGKSYPRAFDDLKTLEKDFAGMEVAEWAWAKDKELAADPAVKDEVAAWEALEKAQELESKAEGKAKKLGAAKTAYKRLAKKYPETRAGKLAEEALARLGA